MILRPEGWPLASIGVSQARFPLKPDPFQRKVSEENAEAAPALREPPSPRRPTSTRIASAVGTVRPRTDDRGANGTCMTLPFNGPSPLIGLPRDLACRPGGSPRSERTYRRVAATACALGISRVHAHTLAALGGRLA